MFALSPYAKALAKSIGVSILIGCAFYIVFSAYSSALESIHRSTKIYSFVHRAPQKWVIDPMTSFKPVGAAEKWDVNGLLHPDPLKTNYRFSWKNTWKNTDSVDASIAFKVIPESITIYDTTRYQKIYIRDKTGRPVVTETKTGWEITLRK